MAPVDQYLMERDAEILLARSAAPHSISSDATVLILGRQGYETVVRGKSGFVCMVERGWMEAFDSPEFWNSKVRGAECLNRQAARSILPIAELRTRDHNGPHLMFFTALKDGKDWGAFAAGSPSCKVVRRNGRTHASRVD
jgi:hypothetical protein